MYLVGRRLTRFAITCYCNKAIHGPIVGHLTSLWFVFWDFPVPETGSWFPFCCFDLECNLIQFYPPAICHLFQQTCSQVDAWHFCFGMYMGVGCFFDGMIVQDWNVLVSMHQNHSIAVACMALSNP